MGQMHPGSFPAEGFLCESDALVGSVLVHRSGVGGLEFRVPRILLHLRHHVAPCGKPLHRHMLRDLSK